MKVKRKKKGLAAPDISPSRQVLGSIRQSTLINIGKLSIATLFHPYQVFYHITRMNQESVYFLFCMFCICDDDDDDDDDLTITRAQPLPGGPAVRHRECVNRTASMARYPRRPGPYTTLPTRLLY